MEKNSSIGRHMPTPDRRAIPAAALSLLLSLPALAQEPGADIAAAAEATPVAEQSERPASSSRLVEEIVVTAQKREEAIQDVPISIQAFSAEQLDARGLVNVRDLSMATPGLTFTDIAGYTLIYLRGVGTDAFVPSADPSIATYIDGIYFPSNHSLAQSFGALERIEVLKGPQGTLFGRNSTGGAISVVTKKPDSVPETSIQASYARFDDLKARVYTNIPLGDTLAFSISGLYQKADPYYDYERPTLDNPQNSGLLPGTSKGARARLRWYPTENLDVTLTGMTIEQNGSGTVLSVTTDPSPLAQLLGVQAETRDYVAQNSSIPRLKTRTHAAYGEIDWTLPSFDVKLLGSTYEVIAHDFQYDFDGSAQPLITFVALPEFQEIKTAELQFISNPDSWGSQWLKWVGGLYYLDSEGGYDPAYLSIANEVINLPTQGLADLLQLPVDALGPLLPDRLESLVGGLPLPGGDGVGLYFRGVLGTKSYSAFVQTTATLTEWFDLTLGARYQREERDLLVSNVEIDNVNGGSTVLIPFAPRGKEISNFSPKVSLDFRVIDDVLVYLSWQRGFKSATYNIVNIYLPPDFVKPEEVSAYELGLKSTTLDGALRFNAAVFQTDIKNLQTSSVSLLSGGAVNFENAGEAQIRGVEFDAIWVPMPEINAGLVLSASASFLDAEYTDYKDGNGFDEVTGLNFESRDFSGNKIARTPDFSGTFTISQTIETGVGPIELGGDYYYNEGFFFTAQNSASSKEPAYAIINARVSWLYEPWNTRVTVFGNNLGDERYNLQQFHTDFGRADTLAPPRVVGMRLDWEF